MKSIISFVIANIVLISFHSGLNAQVYFQKTIGGGGGEQSYSVTQVADGGYITAGSTVSFGAGLTDGYIARLDASGDTIWTKAYGGGGDEEFYFIRQTSDSGFIASGYTSSFGAGLWDVYLVKTDANGDTLWTKAYGGTGYENGASVQQTFDGGYIITGYTDTYGAGSLYEVYLIRTDAVGDTLWTRTFGGGNWDWANYVLQTSDSGFIAAGTTMSYGEGNYEMYLVKTDANGDTLWTRTYGESGNDDCYSIQQTTDGGYIMLGITDNFGVNSPDFYALKLDANGDTLWTKTYGGNSDDYGYGVRQTADGGYIFVGLTQSFGAGLRDAYLIRTDANGDTLWTRAYGGTLEDWANSVQECSDAGFVVSVPQGSFGAGSYDFMTLKVDSMGNVGCNQNNTTTQVGNTATLMNFGGMISSGGIVSNTTTIVTNAASQETLLCVTCDTLIADFFYIDTFGDVSFFDTSTNATGWYWDFGDGNFDSIQNPSHTYGTADTFLVCLIASNPCTSDTICDSVIVIIPGINEAARDNQIEVYPNPNSGMITVRTADKRISSIEIYNLMGAKVYETAYRKEEMDISSLPSGVYMLSAMDEQGVTLARQKIIRQ